MGLGPALPGDAMSATLQGALAAVALSVPVGGYGCWSIIALLLLRRLPHYWAARAEHPVHGPVDVFAEMDPRWRRRLLTYAWIGVALFAGWWGWNLYTIVHILVWR